MIAAPLVLLIFLVTNSGPLLHEVEIKIFGSTMAIAKTVQSACPGTSVDDYYLEALRLQLHVKDADYPAFVEEVRAAAQVLQQGLTEAPSRQAWCDAVYRLYGPEGKMIRGLMQRWAQRGRSRGGYASIPQRAPSLAR